MGIKFSAQLFPKTIQAKALKICTPGAYPFNPRFTGLFFPCGAIQPF